MSSNCFISFFGCCSSRKRNVIHSESTIYSNLLHNASTQTRKSNHSESLPALRIPAKMTHRPIIMIKHGDSFKEQLSEDISNSDL